MATCGCRSGSAQCSLRCALRLRAKRLCRVAERHRGGDGRLGGCGAFGPVWECPDPLGTSKAATEGASPFTPSICGREGGGGTEAQGAARDRNCNTFEEAGAGRCLDMPSIVMIARTRKRRTRRPQGDTSSSPATRQPVQAPWSGPLPLINQSCWPRKQSVTPSVGMHGGLLTTKGPQPALSGKTGLPTSAARRRGSSNSLRRPVLSRLPC